MLEQMEAFPKTELDEATAVLSHLIGEEEKAKKASIAADDKLADAVYRVRQQRHVVARLQSMMPAAEPVAQATAEDDDIEDAEVLRIEGDVLDPITGEIMEQYDSICGDCGGDGRLEDRTGGGHHKCRTCDGTGIIVMERPAPPVVIALYPGDDEPHVTTIGNRTRYSELVADYLVAAELDELPDVYQVWGEDDSFIRNLRDVIAASDYGKSLLVEMTAEAEVTRTQDEEGDAA